ncbi:putative outer membrane lipoprotein [Paraburkholderia youngii]|uniref:hypothetical protein n=1 Tax=Paraburkholderia youngii TaxID=2782701 RepID=UPI003D24AE54
MKTVFQCLLLMVAVVVAIIIGVVVGDYGAWYFSWAIGTAMIVFFSAAGGVLLDTQEREKLSKKH